MHQSDMSWRLTYIKISTSTLYIGTTSKHIEYIFNIFFNVASYKWLLLTNTEEFDSQSEANPLFH